MGPTAYIYEDFLITLSESCQNWISIPCFAFKLQLSITFCLKMSSAARDSVKKDFKISIKQLKWLNDFRFCPFKSVISDINHTRRQEQEILLSNYISLPFEITLPWQSNPSEWKFTCNFTESRRKLNWTSRYIQCNAFVYR